MNKGEIEQPNLKGDRINFALLVLVYVLVGAAGGGIITAIPIILENRNASYAEQAQYSTSGYPLCFKLLWAPVIDCIYSKKFGRRKSWLIPSQYLIGITLLLMSWRSDDLLGTEDGTRKPKILPLTATSFLLIFLMTVLDVAVDGWSITLVQKRNLGYVGNCQTIGASIGQLVTQTMLLMADSKDFSNLLRSVPQDHGFVSLSSSFLFWAITFLVVNTLILFFKKEGNSEGTAEGDDAECRLGLKESYIQLWKVLKLRPIITYSFIMITCKIAFGPFDGVGPLKIMSIGVSKESFIMFTFPAVPLQIIFTIVFAGWLTGPRTLRSFLRVYIWRMVCSALFAVILFLSAYVKDENDSFPAWYYWLLFIAYNAKSILTHMMTICILAFFCRVSDPRFGGIYLALLWTMIAIGHNWTITLSLYLVGILTMKTCAETSFFCLSNFDGFYVESVLCTVFGILWLFWGRKEILKLENLKPSEWIVEQHEARSPKDETLPMVGVAQSDP